jgi:hypothetical protein
MSMVSMDFFTVPPVAGRFLFVLLSHDRRHIVPSQDVRISTQHGEQLRQRTYSGSPIAAPDRRARSTITE